MVSTVIYIALKLVYFAKSDSGISLQISLLRHIAWFYVIVIDQLAT